MTRMRVLFLLMGVFLVFLGGCPNVPPPKQRDDWVLPPTKYGNVEFHGLASPERLAAAQDAGAE